MASLTNQQTFAWEMILEGHNVVLTGQAGTGKTFLLREVVNDLKFIGKKYSLLCSTGIGCMQYYDFGATTVHSWAGLYDGRYDNATLKELASTDDKYEKVRVNISNCEIIIIDEISMLSKKDFEQLELVCRTLKRNEHVFGGIQVVACGDFCQLPPVGNHFYKDSGDYCFESSMWLLTFKHRINFDVIIRQSEPKFIQAVRETAVGNITADTDTFLKSLNRDLSEKYDPVHLFSRNIDAELYNNDKLDGLKTEGRLYTALKNSGPKKFLNKILAPYHLSLKLECPVLLLRNLGGKLVNGLCGRVKGFADNHVVVHFDVIDEMHKVERYNFSVYDINKNVTVAQRNQFPLQLAYGLTIHKSQGMTLNSVYVHCQGIFQSGQLSVAISRAKTSDGLQLENYRKGLCPQPKSVVTHFYGLQSEEFKDGASECCRNIRVESPETPKEMSVTNSDDSDSEDTELDILEKIDVSAIPLLPSYISTDDILKSVIADDPVTAHQLKANEICSLINNDFLEMFLAKQHAVIEGFFESNICGETTTPQIWTAIMNAYHLYVISEEYFSTLPLLYDFNTDISDAQRYVASKLTFKLLQDTIHAKSVETLPQFAKRQKNVAISPAGKAKIRYVGGMCVAKTRKHLCTILHENLGNPLKIARDKVKAAKHQLNFIYSLEACCEEKENALIDSSFDEIERRQNITHCLTYISERCFSFFILLNSKISKLITIETFKIDKETLFEKCRHILKEDQELSSTWVSLCNNYLDSEESKYIFDIIIKRYLMVCQKQFLKDAKSYFNIAKKKKHRQEIEKKSEKRKLDEAINLNFIINDASLNKERSHLKLKINCLENINYFNSKDYTKSDIMKLCEAYSVKYSKCMKKEKLSFELRQSILAAQHMVNSEVVSSPVATTSQEPPKKISKRSKTPSKGKGKGKGKSSKGRYFCGMCNSEYQISEDWIQCDSCSKWFHRVCADLENDEAWESVQAIEVEWLCAACTY